MRADIIPKKQNNIRMQCIGAVNDALQMSGRHRWPDHVHVGQKRYSQGLLSLPLFRSNIPLFYTQRKGFDAGGIEYQCKAKDRNSRKKALPARGKINQPHLSLSSADAGTL